MESYQEGDEPISTAGEWPEVRYCGARCRLVDVSGDAVVSDDGELSPQGPVEPTPDDLLLHFPPGWRGGERNEKDIQELLYKRQMAEGDEAWQINKVLFALHEETETTTRSREQFLAMLFDSDGSVRPGGYGDLLNLKQRLKKQDERLFPRLVDAAVGAARFPDESRASVKALANDYWDVRTRREVLQAVLNRFEISGEKPSEWDLLVEYRRQRDEHDPVVLGEAELVVQVFIENEGKYSGRHPLLMDVLERCDSANDLDTIIEHLGDLYPDQEKPGRPQKEEGEALLIEMVYRCYAALRNAALKKGKTGGNPE